MAKYTKMDLLKAMEVEDIYPGLIEYHSINIIVKTGDKIILKTKADGIINVNDNEFSLNSNEIDLRIKLDDIKSFEAEWIQQIEITI